MWARSKGLLSSCKKVLPLTPPVHRLRTSLRSRVLLSMMSLPPPPGQTRLHQWIQYFGLLPNDVDEACKASHDAATAPMASRRKPSWRYFQGLPLNTEESNSSVMGMCISSPIRIYSPPSEHPIHRTQRTTLLLRFLFRKNRSLLLSFGLASCRPARRRLLVPCKTPAHPRATSQHHPGEDGFASRHSTLH